MLSLLSFDANDPSLNHVVSGAVKVKNKAGLFGAYTAGFLNDVFGVAAYLCPLIFGALGAAYVSPSYSLHWSRWLGFFLLTICLLVIGAAADVTVGDMWGGGMVGNALHISHGIRQGALLLIGHSYANAEAVAIGTIATQLPMATQALWQPHRWVNI